MTTFTIPRTGQAPLRFTGELIAETSTRLIAGRERNRWFVLKLYRTGGGKFPLSVAFRTRWEGEHDTDRVVLCGSTADVRIDLSLFQPLGMSIIGYPAGEHYAERQARLEQTLRLDWETAVRDLLGQVSEEFAEEIA
jgi:hypothetical protein